tara:strand:- start:2061 stop:2270 length:210 start_codon:yes stop_codon:yes gene_type:complete
MREYYDNRHGDYPSPSKKATRSAPSDSAMQDSTRTESVKAGECLDKPEEAKVKAAYGQTRGLLWYRSIK